MSDFSVPIIKLGEVQRHPNADTLSFTKVFGEEVVFRTGDFKEGGLAVYVPVEAVIPMTVRGTEFLGSEARHRRIKAKRLRGLYSEGLLLPLNVLGGDQPASYWKEGMDVARILNIVKHEDTLPAMLGGTGSKGRYNETTKSPVDIPEFDAEPFSRQGWRIKASDQVVVTEKLHGTQVRFIIHEKKVHVGSHRVFWKDDRRLFARARNLWRRVWGKSQYPQNLYWKLARQLELKQLTKLEHANSMVFYGEIFGDVQDLKYDHELGRASFRCFAIYDLDVGYFVPWDMVESYCEVFGLQTVPVLYKGPADPAAIRALVEGQSILAPKQLREGVVVSKADDQAVRLKWVSRAYKLRKGGTEAH